MRHVLRLLVDSMGTGSNQKCGRTNTSRATASGYPIAPHASNQPIRGENDVIKLVAKVQVRSKAVHVEGRVDDVEILPNQFSKF